MMRVACAVFATAIIANVAQAGDWPRLGMDRSLMYFRVRSVPALTRLARRLQLEKREVLGIPAILWPHAKDIEGSVVALDTLALVGRATLDVDLRRLAARAGWPERLETYHGVTAFTVPDDAGVAYYFQKEGAVWFASSKDAWKHLVDRLMSAPFTEEPKIRRCIQSLQLADQDATFILCSSVLIELSRKRSPESRILPILESLGISPLEYIGGGIRIMPTGLQLTTYCDLGESARGPDLARLGEGFEGEAATPEGRGDVWRWPLGPESNWIAEGPRGAEVLAALDNVRKLLGDHAIMSKANDAVVYAIPIRQGVDRTSLTSSLGAGWHKVYGVDLLWTNGSVALAVAGRQLIAAPTQSTLNRYLTLNSEFDVPDAGRALKLAEKANASGRRIGRTTTLGPAALWSLLLRAAKDGGVQSLTAAIPFGLAADDVQPMAPAVHFASTREHGVLFQSFVPLECPESTQGKLALAHVQTLIDRGDLNGALAAWTKVLGSSPVSSDSRIADRGSKLALSLALAGEASAAADVCRNILSRSYAGLPVRQRFAVHALAARTAYLSGNLDAFREHCSVALKFVQTHRSTTHMDAIVTRADFASVILDAGEFEEGGDLLDGVLASCDSIDGFDVVLRARFRAMRGYAHFGLGEYGLAIPVLRSSLATLEAHLGRANQSVIRQREGLASTAIESGDLVLATKLLAITENQNRVLQGENSLSYARSLIVSGRLNLARGLPAEAERDLKRARSILDKLDEPRLTARTLFELGRSAACQRQYENAARRFRLSLQAWSTDRIPSRPEVGRCKAELASVLRSLGETSKARELVSEAEEALSGLPRGHPWRSKLPDR